MSAKKKLTIVVDNDCSEYVDPLKLHTVLRRTATHEISFPSEKRMASYRRMLYDVNRQGTYKYRTLRSESAPYGIVIWRMK